MALGTAVKESAALALKSRLETINATTFPDVYSFTPTAVVRPSRMDNITPADKLLVLSQSEDDRVLGRSDGNVCWRDIATVFSIDCFCFPDADSSTNAIDTTRNAREADVITAIMADPTLITTGSPILLGTSICLETLWWDYTEFCGFTVRFEAHIRHKETDPRVNGVS